MNPGDVFVRQYPDGRYGAVRILRKEGKSLLVYTSAYLADRPPLASDELLRTPVEQLRFFWRGQLAMRWTSGRPTANFSFAFNLPLTDVEAATACDTRGGAWWEGDGMETYLEWRWTHDREALEQEMRADDARRGALSRQQALAQKPKRMMSERDFWALIEKLDWSHTGNDDAVVAPLVAALADLPKTAIRHFAERLAYLLYNLDTREHAKHIGLGAFTEGGDGFSDDGFLYARCAVVANGQAVYENALATPEDMPKDIEFEALLSVASAAFEAKTGEDLDYETGCSCESGSNVAGWVAHAV